MATAAQTKIEVQNFIDGERRPAVQGDSEAVLNPATGEQIATAPLSDEKDVVVATYTVKIEGTDPNGKDISGTYNAGTVWKDEGGQWMAIFHTHAKQATP